MSFHQIISRFCQKRPNSREIRGSYSAIDSIVTVDVKPFLSEGENPIRFASPGPVPTPKDIYNGGFPDAPQQGIRLRISNGGAGQAGLIKAWADAFIQYQVAKGAKPFEVKSLCELCCWVLTFSLIDCLVSYGHNWQSSDVSVRYCRYRTDV